MSPSIYRPACSAVLALLLIVLPWRPGQTQPTPAKAPPLSIGLALDEPVAFRNLAIFPLVTETDGEMREEFLTLDAGLEKKLVAVYELGAARDSRASQSAPGQLPPPQPPPGGSGGPAPSDAERQLLERQARERAELLERQLLERQAREREQLAERQARDLERLRAGQAAGQPAAAPQQPAPAPANARASANCTACVNKLEVENLSDLPLYLMAGEIVLGGRQDRIVAADVLVAPKSRREIAVFCCERDRWNGGTSFETSGGCAHGNLRQTAQDGKKQDEVWRVVRDTNKKLGVGAATQAYRASLGSAQLQALKADYLKPFEANFKLSAKTVGCVVALRGEVLLLDRFGAPALFRAFWPKLLRSFILGAIIEAQEYRQANPAADPCVTLAAPSRASVDEFVKAVAAGKASPAETRESGAAALALRSQRTDSDTHVGFTHLQVNPAAANDPGRLLHQNFYRKPAKPAAGRSNGGDG